MNRRLRSFALWLNSITFCCCCVFPVAENRQPPIDRPQQPVEKQPKGTNKKEVELDAPVELTKEELRLKSEQAAAKKKADDEAAAIKAKADAEAEIQAKIDREAARKKAAADKAKAEALETAARLERISPATLAKLDKGASFNQAVKLLGEPTTKRQVSTIINATWSDEADDPTIITITFQNFGVSTKSIKGPRAK